MRIIIQRVHKSHVTVNDQIVGAIDFGLLLFVGISRTDTKEVADYLLDKVLGLRIFSDAEGKMNLSVAQAGGSLLIISQFTLYADCRRGRRPSFDQAAPPDRALVLYRYFVDESRKKPVKG